MPPDIGKFKFFNYLIITYFIKLANSSAGYLATETQSNGNALPVGMLAELTYEERGWH